MKSQEKVKRQRRIKSIAPYCDNPSPYFMRVDGIGIASNRRVGKHRNSKFVGKKIAHRRTLRRINRTSN